MSDDAVTYRVRSVAPRESRWFEIAAASPDDAAQEAVVAFGNDGLPMFGVGVGKGKTVYVARVEVEGHGERYAKMTHTGIYRRGGVKPDREARWRECANAIGWDRSVDELKEEWT